MGRRLNPTSTTIRKGYTKLEFWSLAEAAEYSGLAVSTLRKHARAGRFVIVKTASPYKVISETFRGYIHTGEPQKIQVKRTLF